MSNITSKRSKKKKRNSSQSSNEPRKTKERIAKYCICRKPWDGKAMIQCPTCSEWFHYICIDLKQTSPVYWDDFFPCPFCVKNASGNPGKLAENSKRCKNETNNMLENAANTPELSGILQTIPLKTVKQFIKDQISNDSMHQSMDRYYECMPINHVLCGDLIQLIMSFGGNRQNAVCKQWNKLCTKEGAIRSRTEYEKIKERNLKDKSEDYLWQNIDALRCQRQKYDDMIEDLKRLSAYYCVKCGKCGHDNEWLRKCSMCEKEVCYGCMLKCEAGDGDKCELEYYCCNGCSNSNDCGGLCEGEDCGRTLCDSCFEARECSKCNTKICESCAESYDYCEYYLGDYEPEMVTLCKECYNYEIYKER